MDEILFSKGCVGNIKKLMEEKRRRIVDVLRKPRKCPVCGERVVDIIYGTGDMTQIEFFLAYRQEGIVGGNNIPRRPPIWECSCGCKRFRKVNPDGTDAPVKVKLLKNVRRKPLALMDFSTELVLEAIEKGQRDRIKHYLVLIETEFGEKEKLNIKAVNEQDARYEAIVLILEGRFGLKGVHCKKIEVKEK